MRFSFQIIYLLHYIISVAMLATLHIGKKVFFTCQLLNKSFGWSAEEKIIPKSCLSDVWNSWTISVKMAKDIPLLPSNFNYFWNLVGNNSFSFISPATITRKLSDHEGQYLLKVFQKKFFMKSFYLNLSRREAHCWVYTAGQCDCFSKWACWLVRWWYI